MTFTAGCERLYEVLKPDPTADDYDDRIEMIEDVLHAAIARARDPAVIGDLAVRYRQDVDPVLAGRLGLDTGSTPDLETISRLMSLLDAGGGKIDGKHYPAPGRPVLSCEDCPISASKPVALAYALASSPDERKAILDAHREAVDAALREKIEGYIGIVRLGDGGRKGSEPGHTFWICFDHEQSRFGDPQLHTHCVIINVVQSRISDKVGSLFTKNLHGKIKGPGSVDEFYQQALAENLTRAGIDAWYDADRAYAMVRGVSDEAADAFSTRRAAGEERAREYAESRGWVFDELPQHVQARLITGGVRSIRKAGTPGTREQWQQRARDIGWQPQPSFTIDDRYNRANVDIEWEDRHPPMPSI